jgi:hypothetical protein
LFQDPIVGTWQIIVTPGFIQDPGKIFGIIKKTGDKSYTLSLFNRQNKLIHSNYLNVAQKIVLNVVAIKQLKMVKEKVGLGINANLAVNNFNLLKNNLVNTILNIIGMYLVNKPGSITETIKIK